jgi:acyl-CoA reductase-like NAD-dependent aldehyde dehydrogenase
MVVEPAPVKKPEPVKSPTPDPPVDTAARKSADQAKSAVAEAKKAAEVKFKGRIASENPTYARAAALQAEGEQLYKRGDYAGAKSKLQSAKTTYEEAKPTPITFTP